MILRGASRHTRCCNQSLRQSYVEISRYVRTRSHGTTSPTLRNSLNGVRNFSLSIARRDTALSESLQKSLGSYKQTLLKNTNTLHDWSSDLDCRPVDDTEIIVQGYLGSRRNISKNLTFAVLRNPAQTSCVQIVSNGQDLDSHSKLKSLREWTPVAIRGVLKHRRPAEEKTLQGMTLVINRELLLIDVTPLNEMSNDIIVKEDTAFSPEQRHLQLRLDRATRQNLVFRSEVSKWAQHRLGEEGFLQVETPILFKSTPEGAREFLVPTRNKGLAYALPQSPQQYKQILMASGVHKYYQVARCFRDEDLRADRQPEFTQLDLEMAFVGDDEVMDVIQNLMYFIGEKCMEKNWMSSPEIPRMTYQEAMASYGSDKPDLRLGAKVHQITEKLPRDLIGKMTGLEDPTIDAFVMEVSDDAKITRKFISRFLDSSEGRPFLQNPDGQPGIFVVDMSQPQQGLGALGHGFLMNWPEDLDIDHGWLLVLQARKNERFYGGSTMMGNLRLALHKAAVSQGLIAPPEGYAFTWINDFPLFTPSNDVDPGQGGAAGLSATHHPFTAPKTAADVDLLLTEPEKVVAAHYDLVVNGVELGGGSRRIHNADVQEFIFRDVLRMKQQRIEDFRHLLDVLRSGCPPHAGIALGWDRLIAVMLGKESVRDVIAFPKSGKGEDMLVKAPNALTKAQLDTYHLQLKD
ncbi:aspartyl-tRNA synthetase [Polyplosphaeria fusca]|uniref:Aspartyl-tRNA synthetase n=1 Tax=Polyplosphaeria fusca TaxID=682080 RepID=A0A9P4V9C1_9PLEO|nr:aspartyl-tRNA synthetase [Polyplosphaeria fusca]